MATLVLDSGDEFLMRKKSRRGQKADRLDLLSGPAPLAECRPPVRRSLRSRGPSEVLHMSPSPTTAWTILAQIFIESVLYIVCRSETLTVHLELNDLPKHPHLNNCRAVEPLFAPLMTLFVVSQ